MNFNFKPSFFLQFAKQKNDIIDLQIILTLKKLDAIRTQLKVL
jgi:hypothetical protein